MKYFLILSLLFSPLLALADFLDEQDLFNKEKTCTLHYLTTMPRKLWTISVDQAYCKDGFVQGFTTVTLRDSLDRDVETLHGFFHQGYWLTDFVGNIDQFYRFSPDEGIQDFIFKSGENKDLHLVYYTVARALKQDDKRYNSFTSCAPETTLIVAHDPVSDFKQSLFQSALLKQAQEHQLKLCSETNKIHILGVPANSHVTTDMFFQADIDLQTEEISLSYHTPIDKNEIPKPLELRHEQGENILTIRPQKSGNVDVFYGEDAVSNVPQTPAQSTASKKIKDLQSATDLALISRITDTQSEGNVVVYIDHFLSNQMAVVTRPFHLLVDSQIALTPGWYLINGQFSYDGENYQVKVLSSQSCRKEWCADEN